MISVHMVFSLLSALIAFTVMLGSAGAQAPHRTLIAIGYGDFHPSFWDTLGFGRYDYEPALGAETERALRAHYESRGYQCVSDRVGDAQAILCHDVERSVVILNSNVSCAGEEGGGAVLRIYRGECLAQRNQSASVKSYVERELFNFDTFVYIGHARGGGGLAFTNKSEQAELVNLNDLYVRHIGAIRLKRAILAACDSEEYYANSFYQFLRPASGVEVRGVRGKRFWLRELLPLVLEQLNSKD